MMDVSDGREFINLGLDKTVSQIIARLKAAPKGPVLAEGSWGSFAPLLAAHISKELNRPILYTGAHIDDADKAADDLTTFEAGTIETFPTAEGDQTIADASDETKSQRLKIVLQILSGQKNFLIPTSVLALCQPIPEPELLYKNSLELNSGEEKPIETVLEWLVDNNFENVDRIDLPGQFARRGGIIDIFAPLATYPSGTDNQVIQPTQTALAVRIEFFGDTIESIRLFNTDTQRSVQQAWII